MIHNLQKKPQEFMKKNHDLVLFEVISVNHIRNREYGAH